jgi:hypothetical protein
MFNIASVSPYGQAINIGSTNLFNYEAGAPLQNLLERPSFLRQVLFSMFSIDDALRSSIDNRVGDASIVMPLAST